MGTQKLLQQKDNKTRKNRGNIIYLYTKMSVTIIRKSSLEETVQPESVNDTQMLPDLLDQIIKAVFLCA